MLVAKYGVGLGEEAKASLELLLVLRKNGTEIKSDTTTEPNTILSLSTSYQHFLLSLPRGSGCQTILFEAVLFRGFGTLRCDRSFFHLALGACHRNCRRYLHLDSGLLQATHGARDRVDKVVHGGSSRNELGK